ncbi:Uncharacterized protein HZ326_27687 [Fusarium oxysporum f. sp. albedinis]|nr:Uncharacterized protein HZ326_27687 [Fusarium oxysporum f. sp. albedinis]
MRLIFTLEDQSSPQELVLLFCLCARRTDLTRMSAGAAKNKSPKWSPLTEVNDYEEKKRKRPKVRSLQ